MARLIGVGALILDQQTRSQNRVMTSGKALIGGPFELVGKDGKTVTDKDFRGRYMLVFFGFTHCPDICPAELQVMSAALDDLGAQGRRGGPDLHHLDPERDTPELVSAYVAEFRPELRGADRLARRDRQGGQSLPRHLPEVSRREHWATITASTIRRLLYLMGPDGEFVTHFPTARRQKKWLRRCAAYL